ncbi:MAG: Acetylornithine/succinyldiaminopimelate aminotransferase [Methanobacteriota archaeon]|nr:MAG: Acetylornithine/succinyldiaminopimelate aminotransferase [Euryarchaeota archaeon]
MDRYPEVPQAPLDILHQIRELSGSDSPLTIGLDDERIQQFCELDSKLVQAIEEAWERHSSLLHEFDSMQEVMGRSESEQIQILQSRFVNFYSPATINPYVALAARGPWIVTSKGAVVHDNGGYGMLGFGHGPQDVMSSMGENWVMANVMTPSFSQYKLSMMLERELGHTRGFCPFTSFICMNSGSESVTVALRIADVNARIHTDPGGRYEGRRIVMLAIEEAFHGRTDRPAQISHSCKGKYDDRLATFRDRDNLLLVPANDISALQEVFARADAEDLFIEVMAIEPVQGEGNPGQCITREFYDEARRLTMEHGSMLLVDSIQAGIRGQGCLSIIDYEGFQDAEAPDLETWSKALNAGQYPLSVLGMTPRSAELYVVGIYGNTMTTNPRALETAVSVLKQMTPELRQNIRERGNQLVEGLSEIQDEMPDVVLKVQGTGLLCCAELNPETHKVVGFGEVEETCRKMGLGIIHGGQNALRFTPHFRISVEEIELVVDLVRAALIRHTEASS